MRVTSYEVNEALMFISALAEGINPITEQQAESGDTLNHPAVIRKMYAVRTVLETMLDMITQDERWEQSECFARCRELINPDLLTTTSQFAVDSSDSTHTSSQASPSGGTKSSNRKRPEDAVAQSGAKSSNTIFEIPEEILAQYSFERNKTITALLDQIYAPMDTIIGKKLAALHVNRWLVETGIMEEAFDMELNRKAKKPTALGEALGIHGSVKLSHINGQKYMDISYMRSGQRFIVSNINHIINGEAPDLPAELSACYFESEVNKTISSLDTEASLSIC